MGIKAFNTFLRKRVETIKISRVRAYLEELANKGLFRDEIYQTVIPLDSIERIVNQCQIIGNRIEKSATTVSEFELSQKLLIELPRFASIDPVFKHLPFEYFRGRRIAIDANNWMFCHISVANKRVILNTDLTTSLPNRNLIIQLWLTRLLDDICLFINHGITPVFIFDGITPDEKDATRAKRIEKKNNIKGKIEQLREQITSADILERSQQNIDEYRKLLCQVNYISSDETSMMKQILEGIGIPFIEAKDEAEKLCSMLTIEGITAASFSTDTDNLTYGCPLVITGFNGSGGVSVISINDVLACLDMSYREFVDLCIMAGCDYNDNIPKIGIGKSHKLLKEYHSIDNITKYDVQCLKHIKCRQLFAYVHSGLLIVSGYLDVNKNALMNTARDVLTNFHLDNYMERLVKLYQQLSQPVNSLPQPPTKPRLNIV